MVATWSSFNISYFRAATTHQPFLQTDIIFLWRRPEFWCSAGKHKLLTELCHSLLIHKNVFCSWTWEFHKWATAPAMWLSIVHHLQVPVFTPHATATSQAREQSHRTQTQEWHQAVTRFLLLCKTHYFPDPEKKWIIMLLAYVSEIRLRCSCRHILCYQQTQSDLLWNQVAHISVHQKSLDCCRPLRSFTLSLLSHAEKGKRKDKPTLYFFFYWW